MENHVEKLKHTGRVYIWKFIPENRNYPGWNLTADIEGCNSLIKLLQQMQLASFPSHKTIITHPATINQVKAATDNKPFETVGRIALKFRKGEQQLWQTEERNDVLEIRFGEREMQLLQTALQRIIKGEGDFAIGDAENEHLVYFWWLPENK